MYLLPPTKYKDILDFGYDVWKALIPNISEMPTTNILGIIKNNWATKTGSSLWLGIAYSLNTDDNWWSMVINPHSGSLLLHKCQLETNAQSITWILEQPDFGLNAANVG